MKPSFSAADSGCFHGVAVREQAEVRRVDEALVPWLGGFLERALLEVLAEAGRELRHQVMLLGERAGFLRRGLIRQRRAGGDHRGQVVRDIRNVDGKLPGRMRMDRQAAALDRGHMLPQDVDLLDRQAARDQHAVEFEEILEGYRGIQRLFKKGRAAARDQENYGIVRRQARDEFQRGVGGGKAVGIGIRMSAHEVAKTRQLLDELGGSDRHAAFDAAFQNLVEDGGHAAGGLAEGNDARRAGKRKLNVPGLENLPLPLELGEHRVTHIDGRQGFQEDLLRQLLPQGEKQLGSADRLALSSHARLADASWAVDFSPRPFRVPQIQLLETAKRKARERDEGRRSGSGARGRARAASR